MKHLLTFSLFLFTLSLHAAFTRLATETYPGGGGGPTGGVTKAYVDAADLATLFASTNYTDDATNALDLANLAALAATNTALRSALAASAASSTNYTDTATNTLAASYASQLSYASKAATNYTDASTLSAINFVKAGYLPLDGSKDMTGPLKLENKYHIYPISSGAKNTLVIIGQGTTDADNIEFGNQYKSSPLTPDNTPVVTSNMLNGVLAPATNALDTALRAEIDNEEDERKTADSKLLTKESTSYPATRNIKWSGYNLVLMGPMLFETWSKIKAGTASSNTELPEYLADGAWNTAADPFAKKSDIDASTLTATNHTDSATNALAAYCEDTFQPRSRYQWVRPDDWGVDYTVSDTISTTTVISDKEDANLRVIRSETVKKTPTRNGQAFAVKLDPVSTKPLPMPTWNAVTPGIVINSDGTFTAAQDGLFRISATSGDVIRYADIAAQLKPAITTTNSYYYADKSSTTRKTVNDAALATLNAATLEGAHTIEGVTFVVYNTFTPHMANVAAGNVAPFAVSPHVLACAHHYDVKVTGPITFTDGTSSASVTRLKWINLYDWAMTNGFTEAELSGVRLIRDIDMIICDKATAVPNACIPYFMSKATATSWFGADLTGISCWFLTRDFDQALPMVMLGYSSWASSPDYYGYYANDVRQDILTRLTVMGKQNPGRSGDSGRPVFIMKDGNPIVVAHAYSLGCGPDYVGAFPVIKAFVEWYGDTIKEAL